MSRPKLLDLFCGAGGAAVGYYRAGFDIVGVDHKPQPRYPFDFILGDAMEYMDPSILREYDAVHASPPCQAYSVANHTHGRRDHPDLVPATRERLRASGVFYVIENVPGAPLENPLQLCGLAFELNVRRHRLFESNILLLAPGCGDHSVDYLSVFGGSPRTRTHQIGRTAKNGPMLRRGSASLDAGRRAMGIDWMIGKELSQAIPPAYTEWIGKQLIRALERKATA